jgi:hypothetical protein
MKGDWSKELKITIDLQDQNGKTELTLTHEGLPIEMYDECIDGWNESLDKLEKNLKS